MKIGFEIGWISFFKPYLLFLSSAFQIKYAPVIEVCLTAEQFFRPYGYNGWP